MRIVTVFIALAFASGCSLPRGAAIESEIVSASRADNAPFAVYEVNGASVDDFGTWPHLHGFHSWIGKTRGPSSPIIVAGDEFDLTVWDNTENSLLSTSGQKVVDISGVRVSPGGSVFIPYLDKIYVSGQTPAAAREMIQSKFEEILPSAQVQLTYTAGVRSSASLVGGVGAPGSYPLPNRNYSILNLISLGGGVSPGQRNPQVKLVRNDATYQVSLARLYANASLDTILRGGDKVIVEEDRRYFQALGAAGQEDLIYFTKDTINALEAVSLVGGISDSRGDPKGVLILREYEADEVRSDGSGPRRTDVVFTIDLTNADGLFSARRFDIRPRDVVLVTESPVTKLQTIFGLVGQLFGITNQAQNL